MPSMQTCQMEKEDFNSIQDQNRAFHQTELSSVISSRRGLGELLFYFFSEQLKMSNAALNLQAPER